MTDGDNSIDFILPALYSNGEICCSWRCDRRSVFLPETGAGPGDRNRTHGQRDYELKTKEIYNPFLCRNACGALADYRTLEWRP